MRATVPQRSSTAPVNPSCAIEFMASTAERLAVNRRTNSPVPGQEFGNVEYRRCIRSGMVGTAPRRFASSGPNRLFRPDAGPGEIDVTPTMPGRCRERKTLRTRSIDPATHANGPMPRLPVYGECHHEHCLANASSSSAPGRCPCLQRVGVLPVASRKRLHRWA